MKANRKPYAVGLRLFLIAAVLLLWGCSARGEEFAFETIEKDDSTFGEPSFQITEPRLVVITDPKEADNLQRVIRLETVAKLEVLDYREYFAIAVFQGIQGTTSYGVDVQRVVVNRDTVDVNSDFIIPDPQAMVGQKLTLPRQVIIVPRGNLQKSSNFRLVVNGRVRARQDNVVFASDSTPDPFSYLPQEYILLHVSLREKISYPQLRMVTAQRERYEARNLEVWVVKVEDRANSNTYQVAYNPSDHSLIDDISGLERNESQAYLDINRKQEPADLGALQQETPIPTPTATTPVDTTKALDHIAAREGIPVEKLIVVNQYRREYLVLGKAYWAVTALDNNKDGKFFTVMIDLADGSFVDDVESVEQVEEQARQAKYGKQEPALYDRLSTMQPEDTVKVAVWIAGMPARSEAELFAILADKYPEAKAALGSFGNPFDVTDPDLMRQLENEYMGMLNEDTQVEVGPLVDFLQERGYSVKTFDGLPSVSATLPKSLILEIEQRADVGAIYLIEGTVVPAFETVIPLR